MFHRKGIWLQVKKSFSKFWGNSKFYILASSLTDEMYEGDLIIILL